MTTTANLHAIAIDHGTAVAERLQHPLRDAVALSLVGKQAHWVLRGGSFLGVHRLLDELVGQWREAGDAIAERIAALGVVPHGQATDAARSDLAPLPERFLEVDEAVREVVLRIDVLIASLRTAQSHLGELDPVSEDLVVGTLGTIEQGRWLLVSQLPGS